LRGFSNHNLNRVGGCAIDAAYLGTKLDLVEDINRESVLQNDAEYVTGPEGLKIFDTKVCQPVVVTFCSDKAGARSFCEGDAEMCLGNSRGDNLIEVFGCLDEVCLPENDITAFRYL
jgi:hypothetical protein